MTSPKIRLFRCDHCGKRTGNCRRCYQLDPHNLQPEYRLLCTPCRRSTGWAEVDYRRPFTQASSSMGGKPW